ncbi:MAG: cupin domain-containing protein [Peptococcaceae bacterium]
MKKLITAADIRNYAEQKQATVYVGAQCIITPAARDAANDYQIRLITTEEPVRTAGEERFPREQIENLVRGIDTSNLSAAVSPQLIEHIVGEVMQTLAKCKQPGELVKEADPCGLRLIRGNSVHLENFNTGNPRDQVKIKELLNLKESPNLSTGFMELENTVFDWSLKGDEICYIMEGALECTVNGNRYTGQAGDVLYLPENSQVRYSAREKTRYFYVTYPAGSKK